MAGRLSLLTVDACLAQSRAQLSQFRSLTGLPLPEADQVVMTSLERLAGWILNLPADHDRVDLLPTALARGCARMQAAALTDPGARMAQGLGAALAEVGNRLHELVVSDPAQPAAEWGPLSCSLWGWSSSQRCREVVWRQESRLPLPAWPVCLAGRILSGVTLSFLERQGAQGMPVFLEAFSNPPAMPSTATMVDAPFKRILQSLVARGVWGPQAAVQRVWGDAGGLYLLWPLGGLDLQQEMRRLDPARLPEGVDTTAAQWLAHLAQLGIVQDRLYPRHHPGLQRVVQAVGFTPETAAFLAQLLCGKNP